MAAIQGCFRQQNILQQLTRNIRGTIANGICHNNETEPWNLVAGSVVRGFYRDMEEKKRAVRIRRKIGEICKAPAKALWTRTRQGQDGPSGIVPRRTL